MKSRMPVCPGGLVGLPAVLLVVASTTCFPSPAFAQGDRPAQTPKASGDRLPVQSEMHKERAHQVPVESFEEADEPAQGEQNVEEPASGAGEATAADGAPKETRDDTTAETANGDADSKPERDKSAAESKPETGDTGSGVAMPETEQGQAGSGAIFSDHPPAPDRKSGSSDSAASDSAASPGLPRRKPPKPVIRKADRDRKSGRPNPALRRTDRDKYLCKVLQACRNDFVRCKSKIKHPDQSPEWSAEKEACGAIYKDCVHKDFQGGEWFFTRWFYFQELECK